MLIQGLQLFHQCSNIEDISIAAKISENDLTSKLFTSLLMQWRSQSS